MKNMTRSGAVGALGLTALIAATPSTKTVAATLVDKFIEIVNTRAFDRFSEIMGPIYAQHHASIGDGVPAVVAFFKMSPPDLKLTLVRAIVDGNYVAIISRATGTYNGKAFDSTGVDAFRVENGKFVEHWDNG